MNFNNRITRIACGVSHTICTDDHNQVYTWGWGKHGELGLG